MLGQHCSRHPWNCLRNFEQTVVDDKSLRVWELGKPDPNQFENLLPFDANIRGAYLLWIPDDEDLPGAEKNGQGTNVALADFIYDHEIEELCLRQKRYLRSELLAWLKGEFVGKSVMEDTVGVSVPESQPTSPIDIANGRVYHRDARYR